MAFSLGMRSAANCARYSLAFSLFLFAGKSWQRALFHVFFSLSLCGEVVAEQPLPPTAVVGLRSEAGVAKDRSPAKNIDADRALIGFKEMAITPVDAKHHALEVAREEISGLAVERAALIHDFERRQSPGLLDIVELDRFTWEPD